MIRTTICKSLTFIVIFILFFSIVSSPLVSAPLKNECKDIENSCEISSTMDFQLDEKYIYNLTYALSQIVFTEYDYNTEIPKGRFFGSKGELKAAEILAENMSEIGLYVTKQRLEPETEFLDKPVTSLLELLDYDFIINGEKIECFISPTWIHPQAKEEELTLEINEQGLSFKRLPNNPFIYNAQIAQEKQEFVFITQDQWNDPNGSLPVIDWLKPFLHPLRFYMLFHMSSLLKIREETNFFMKNYPNCKGYVLYDFNDKCYDMIYFEDYYKNFLPTIFMNGSLGKKIWENPEDYTLNMYLKQQYNNSIESYNVIGQINGTDPSKTIIISSLYDCWWNQGTADSAIGTAIVVAIAKYFKENELQPKYTMKFICFSGEECGMRGANYYEAVQRDENIIYMIDLNQLGFSQNYPTLTFDIVSNKASFLNELYSIALKTNYYERTGYETEINKVLMLGIPSNTLSFSSNRKDCNCVSLFKDGGWILHHRNGQNYTEGDVLKYYDPNDVKVTGELILNLTKALALDSSPFEECNQNNKISYLISPINYLTSFMKIGPKNAR